MARTKVLAKEKEFTEEKELIVNSVTGEVTGEILPEDQAPESLSIPKEEQINGSEQLQFVGTDGWGIIKVKHSEGYDTIVNAKWEIQDKFFHILEKGREKEEGLYIPLTKVVYFRFDRQGLIYSTQDKKHEDKEDNNEPETCPGIIKCKAENPDRNCVTCYLELKEDPEESEEEDVPF